QQSDEQRRLPHAAEIDVFITLMSEPEPEVARKQVHNAHPLPDHRTEHDNEQSAEQHVNAELLKFRLVAADIRCDEKPGGEPRRSDPENAELCVPRSRHDIRQPFIERNAVTSAAFDAVMRRY